MTSLLSALISLVLWSSSSPLPLQDAYYLVLHCARIVVARCDLKDLLSDYSQCETFNETKFLDICLVNGGLLRALGTDNFEECYMASTTSEKIMAHSVIMYFGARSSSWKKEKWKAWIKKPLQFFFFKTFIQN